MDFTALSSAFTGFVNTLTRRPLATIVGAFLLSSIAGIGMLVYVGFTDPTRVLDLADRLASVVVEEPVPVIEPIPVPIPPEEEAKRLQESIPRDRLTCAAVDMVGEEFAAERATFWTFSNGSYGLGGVPFNFANVHCPYVREGIAYIPEEFQKIPNAISAETNDVLFPQRGVTACGHWTKNDITSPYIKASMQRLGTVEMLQCGVRDGRGIPIGKIVISWGYTDKTRSIPLLLKKLRTTADAIGHYNTPTIPVEQLGKP